MKLRADVEQTLEDYGRVDISPEGIVVAKVEMQVNDKKIQIEYGKELTFEDVRRLEGVPDRAQYSLYRGRKWVGRLLAGDTIEASNHWVLRTEALEEEGSWKP